MIGTNYGYPVLKGGRTPQEYIGIVPATVLANAAHGVMTAGMWIEVIPLTRLMGPWEAAKAEHEREKSASTNSGSASRMNGRKTARPRKPRWVVCNRSESLLLTLHWLTVRSRSRLTRSNTCSR